MSVGLEQVREEMARYLREKGVRARTAWPPERPRELDRPEVLVSLRGCRMGPGGFQDYLGERYNPETGRWEERFGRRRGCSPPWTPWPEPCWRAAPRD